MPSQGQPGLVIKKILVENNIDSVTQKSTSDHLEIYATNTTSQSIQGLTLYYKITDLSGTSVQSFIVQLAGLVLPANSTTPIHIDTSNANGRFRADPNSLYYLSQNPLKFDVTLNAIGYASAN
ncbi:MAG: hypothetical protein WCP92_07200 [bacterium]